MTEPLAPGVHHDVPEHVYHADPAPEPSLSCSIAQLLLTRSPAHAAVAHPRITKVPQERDEAKFLAGTALHELLLCGSGRFEVIDAEDWRGKSARDVRDMALAAGRVPILRPRWDELQLVIEVVHEQMAESPYLRHALATFQCTPEALEMGAAEVDAAAKVWARCMATRTWPGYTSDLQWLQPPPGERFRHEDRKAHASFSTHRAIDLALDMQRPLLEQVR